MLKLEIKMDENKICTEGKYTTESIYQALEKTFLQYQLGKEEGTDGSVFFCGTGQAGDYGAFGSIITTLKEKPWFMDYVTRWIWYNSDDGENEEDYAVEDVLYHYTRRASAA